MSISNTGPWTITPASEGEVVLGYIIHDGKGGRSTRTMTITVEASTPNGNPVTTELDLGSLTVATGLVVTEAELLAGVTDPDGDTLSVTDVIAISGGTVTGTGPWTITPTAEGPGSATATISDGRGGSVNRAVTWNGQTPFNPGLWNHAAAVASGGSQILGPNRYRIYSATGDKDAVQTLVRRCGQSVTFQGHS